MDSNGKHSDVDIINLFDEFYEQYSSVCSELACKEESLELMVTQKNKLLERNSKLQNEYSTLKTTVSEGQAQLHIFCDLRDEIQLLKKDIVDKEEALKKETRQWRKAMEDLQKDMTASLEEQKLSLTNSHQTLVDKMSETIRNLEGDKTNLEQQLQNLNKEKTAEINSLMMNYESKLSKANRQNAQYKQQQQLVVSQDVLRKKMQHMKASYENETASLNSKIMDLEKANEKLLKQVEKQSCMGNQNSLSFQQPPKSQQDKHLPMNRKRWRGKEWSLSLTDARMTSDVGSVLKL